MPFSLWALDIIPDTSAPIDLWVLEILKLNAPPLPFSIFLDIFSEIRFDKDSSFKDLFMLFWALVFSWDLLGLNLNKSLSRPIFVDLS